MNYYLFRFALVCLNNQGVQGVSVFDKDTEDATQEAITGLYEGAITWNIDEKACFRDEPMRLYPFDDFLAWVLAFEAIRAV